MANDEISSELVNEGRDLIMREKRKKQRNESASRRRDFQLRENVSGRGLLKDNNMGIVGYNTNGSMEPDLSPDYGRTLSQEINARFGVSTDVNFRPEYDEHDSSRPRNIFDDV
jgi:hypothetical protein